MSKWRIKLLAWAIYINSLRIPHKWALFLSLVVLAETARQLTSSITGTMDIYGHVVASKWVIGLLLFFIQLASYAMGRYDQFNKDQGK